MATGREAWKVRGHLVYQFNTAEEVTPAIATWIRRTALSSLDLILHHGIMINNIHVVIDKGFPGDLVVKNPPANAGDVGSIPWVGRSPGVGNGNPLQHSSLETPTDRGTQRPTVHRVAKSQTQLSD